MPPREPIEGGIEEFLERFTSRPDVDEILRDWSQEEGAVISVRLYHEVDGSPLEDEELELAAQKLANLVDRLRGKTFVVDRKSWESVPEAPYNAIDALKGIPIIVYDKEE